VAESSVVLPPAYREQFKETRKISLKVVHAPAIGVVLDTPPVLRASDQSVDYTCGRCCCSGRARKLAALGTIHRADERDGTRKRAAYYPSRR
jgi:hypothetical protein